MRVRMRNGCRIPSAAEGDQLPAGARPRGGADRGGGVGARGRLRLPLRRDHSEAHSSGDAAGRAAPCGARREVRPVERGRLEAPSCGAGRDREASCEGVFEEGRARVRLLVFLRPLPKEGGDVRRAAQEDARDERARGDGEAAHGRQPHWLRSRRERLQDLRAQARQGGVLQGVPVGSAQPARPRASAARRRGRSRASGWGRPRSSAPSSRRHPKSWTPRAASSNGSRRSGSARSRCSTTAT